MRNLIILAVACIACHAFSSSRANALTVSASSSSHADTCFATGDIDGSGVPLMTADLVYLVEYLSFNGPAPNPYLSADLNGDCTVDSLDLQKFACYLENGFSCFDVYPVPTCCMDCSTLGDVDSNGIVLTGADLAYLVAYIDSGGPAPKPLYSGDLNGDCRVDSLDVDKYQCYFINGLSCFPTIPVPTCCELVVQPCFTAGDVDSNGLVLTIADLTYLQAYLFSGGPAPKPLYSGDLNGDCAVDSFDVAKYQCYFQSGISCFTIFPVPTCCNMIPFVAGDADGNDIVTISDAVFLINYIFGGGSAPSPLLSGDVDCNIIVTISDAVYLINYIFSGGAAPANC